MNHSGGQEHSGKHRWLGNHRSEGVSPLDDDLTRVLRDAERRGLRLVVVIASIVPLSAIVAWLLLATGVIQTRELDAHFVIPFAAAFFAFLLALLLGNWPNNRRIWAKKNLRDGRVERFVLSPAASSELDALKAIGSHARPEIPKVIEVYPGTLTLARVGHDITKKPSEVSIAEVADVPAAPTALLVKSDVRSFSPTEIAELRSIQRSSIRPFQIAGIFLFFAWLSFLFGLSSLIGGAAVFLLGAGLCIRILVVRSRTLVPLRRACADAISAGNITSISREMFVEARKARNGPTGLEDVGLFEVAEMLPNSEIPWTLDGEPAPWRILLLSKGKKAEL